VEESEVAVGTQSAQFAKPIADIFYSVVLCDAEESGLFLVEGDHSDLYASGSFLELLEFLIVFAVVEEIPAQLDLCATKNGECFSFLLLGEVGAFESAEGDCLRHADPAFVGGAGEVVEVVGQVEVPQEMLRLSLDERVIEESLEDLADGELACLDDLGLVAVEPALPQRFLLSDLERVLVVPLHLGY
jgi:hypothetical protein